MASTYSTNLALELIGTGDQAGTWGVTTNTNLGTLLEQAISGYVTQAVSTGTDTTITIPNGSTGVARNMYIELTGTGGTNTNLIVPANKKLYFIFNNASGAVTVKVSGQTGVSVPAGKKMILVSNGTDIVNGVNYIADFGTNSFTVTNLTATSATITNLIATTATVSDLSATVLRAASASITNLTLTSLTISSLSITNVSVASATVSSNLTLSGGTANGVLYLNGSKVATSGSALTFDGTSFVAGVSSGAGQHIFRTYTSGGFAAIYNGAVTPGSTNYSFVTNATQTTLNAATFISGEVGGTEGFRLTSTSLYTASGINVGIGTSSPTFSAGGGLHISNATAANLRLQDTTTNVYTNIWQADNGSTSSFLIDVDPNNVGTGGCPLIINTAGSMKVTLSSSGNFGLGVTPSSWRSTEKAIQIGSWMGLYTDSGLTSEVSYNTYINSSNQYIYQNTGYASRYQQYLGEHAWFTAASGTAAGTISFGNAKMVLTNAGNLLVGTTSATATITANASGGATIRALRESVSATNHIQMEHDGTDGKIAVSGANALIFATNSTNQARITSGGDFLVGKTVTTFSTVGATIYATGRGQFTASGDEVVDINRLTNDGKLVRFFQDTVEEGDIAVSGNTVSYNSFAGSHWSQLQDGSKPDILRGTVMESINELCVWPGENNERLPKSKISDTAGSKKVYGVFMAWDNDWSETNDMYVTAVGAFICRVNGSITVQEGDLLESNGDGTARVQADDIIRSSTIGKVTSTVKTHQYADGSYCVPTVLYCG